MGVNSSVRNHHIGGLGGLGNFEIPADLAGQNFIDLGMAGEGGNFLKARIYEHSVSAPLSQNLASLSFQMPDQFSPLHSVATETDSLWTSPPCRSRSVSSRLASNTRRMAS